MSRLIVIDPDACRTWSLKARSMGIVYLRSYPMSPQKKKVSSKVNITLNKIMVSLADPSADLQLGITCEQLCQLQQEDPFCKRIMHLLKSSKLQTNNPYYMEEELLMRNIINNKQCFNTMLLPQVLITQILRAVHEELGHNSSTRTYMLFCRLYYWKA